MSAEVLRRRTVTSRVLRAPKLCPLCGGKLVAADQEIEVISGPFSRRKRGTFTRKRRGCKSCSVVVVLHRWRCA